MAGRRECVGSLFAEGYHTGDTGSSGKCIASKDHNRKKKNGKGSCASLHPTSPMMKVKRGNHGRRCSSDQRSFSGIKNTVMDNLEFIEKDFLSKDRKKLSPISVGQLLNFTVGDSGRPIEYTRNGNGYKKASRSSSFNKEQFILANCQFVVRENGDYSVHATQSDVLVEWNCIEQIRLFCQEIPSCPVCLDLPKAAKITRCGHVFCYSCILHYLALGDKKWRKCPICYVAIYKDDLKSVTTFSNKSHKVNDFITMTLMKREKGTTIVLPCESWADSQDTIGHLNDESRSCFSKLVLASSTEVLSHVIEPEKFGLEEQLRSLSPNEESERCFIEAALEDIKYRCSNIVKIFGNEKNSSSANIEGQSTTAVSKELVTLRSTTDIPIFSGILDETEIENDKISVGLLSTDSQHSPGAPSQKDYYYFYQASDGQNLFIHPLNGKAIATEYGGWGDCPNTLTARIVEIEWHTMTEEEKIRSKYLNHLPLTCEFAFCELQLDSTILSRKTADLFDDEIKKRKQRRQKKKREEKRLEKKQKKQSGDISNPENLDFLSIASSPPLISHIHNTGHELHLPTQTQSDNGEKLPFNSKVLPSFAQALTQGDKKSHSYPITGHKTSVVADHETEDQAIPSFQNSFSNSLLDSSDKLSYENHSGKLGGNKFPKKGHKKIVLFSTAGGNHRL